MRGAAGAHRRRWFDGGDFSVHGLIGSRARADIQNLGRVTEQLMDQGCDAWFRPPVLEVRMADCPVISVSRAAVGESMRHGAFLARKFMISRQTVKGSSKVQQRRRRNSSP